MDNNEVKNLISAFKEYRDLLTPVEQALNAFALSFESLKSDIQNLNSGFDGSLQAKLDKIYRELSSQADKAKTLASEVDKFTSSTSRYVSSVNTLTDLISKVESKLSVVDDLQKRAETQLGKIDVMMEEKRKTYDLKNLEKNLADYQQGVLQVTEYINHDVADNLKDSGERIKQIQAQHDNVMSALSQQKQSVDALAKSFTISSDVLRSVVENGAVNEAYIFEIIDNWAQSRNVKTKSPKRSIITSPSKNVTPTPNESNSSNTPNENTSNNTPNA